MILTPLHDCDVDAMFGTRTVRHRASFDFTEVKLNSGHLRLEGVRCDGTPIALYGNRKGPTRTGCAIGATDDPPEPEPPRPCSQTRPRDPRLAQTRRTDAGTAAPRA